MAEKQSVCKTCVFETLIGLIKGLNVFLLVTDLFSCCCVFIYHLVVIHLLWSKLSGWKNSKESFQDLLVNDPKQQ